MTVGSARPAHSRPHTPGHRRHLIHRALPPHRNVVIIRRSRLMSDFVPGLEGVIAFETEIAEPDKEGGSLRYRGVDIEELVGHVSFGHVWGLLVDNAVNPGLPSAGPEQLPARTGDVRVDVQ